MTVLIRKWGNSAGIRIPASVLAEAKIEIDQAVDVRTERGRIVIAPIHTKAYDIRDLVRRIRSDNLHDLVDTGAPVGREAW